MMEQFSFTASDCVHVATYPEYVGNIYKFGQPLLPESAVCCSWSCSVDAFPTGYDFTLQVGLGCKKTLMAIRRSNIQDNDVVLLLAWTSVHNKEQPECLTVFKLTPNGHKWWLQAGCAGTKSSKSNLMN